jgi:hypothetical protein
MIVGNHAHRGDLARGQVAGEANVWPQRQAGHQHMIRERIIGFATAGLICAGIAAAPSPAAAFLFHNWATYGGPVATYSYYGSYPYYPPYGYASSGYYSGVYATAPYGTYALAPGAMSSGYPSLCLESSPLGFYSYWRPCIVSY